MTKQGAHRDHFLAFLILNAVASGFNMSWVEAAARARTDLARGLGFLREEMVTWFTVAGGALQVPAREAGGDKMTENWSLWNRTTLLTQPRNQLYRDWAERPERHLILWKHTLMAIKY